MSHIIKVGKFNPPINLESVKRRANKKVCRQTHITGTSPVYQGTKGIIYYICMKFKSCACILVLSFFKIPCAITYVILLVKELHRYHTHKISRQVICWKYQLARGGATKFLRSVEWLLLCHTYVIKLCTYMHFFCFCLCWKLLCIMWALKKINDALENQQRVKQ